MLLDVLQNDMVSMPCHHFTNVLPADSQLPTHGTTGKMGGDQVPRGMCLDASITYTCCITLCK